MGIMVLGFEHMVLLGLFVQFFGFASSEKYHLVLFFST